MNPKIQGKVFQSKALRAGAEDRPLAAAPSERIHKKHVPGAWVAFSLTADRMTQHAEFRNVDVLRRFQNGSMNIILTNGPHKVRNVKLLYRVAT